MCAGAYRFIDQYYYSLTRDIEDFNQNIGRGMDCDQVIDHPTISREHAEFLYRNGQFILRDFSTNGSMIVQQGKPERLHRSSMELRGSGKIYLGRTLNQHQYCIEFTCKGSG